MKILAYFKKASQISPDDFEITTKSRLFEPTDTLQDVKDWVKSTDEYFKSKPNFRLFEINIQEPEQ